MCIIEYKDIRNMHKIKGINHDLLELYKKFKSLDDDIRPYYTAADILKENHLPLDKCYFILDFDNNKAATYLIAVQG